MSNPDVFTTILNSTSKHICVIAAPGSGKTTRILIPKAERIIQQHNVNPKEILILSFSRMSANDLKNRIGAIGARASTVHSFCLSILLSEDNHQIRDRVGSIVLDFEKETLVADLKVIFPATKKKTLEKLLKEFSAGWAIHHHDEVFIEDEDRRAFKQAVINWLDEHKATLMEEIVYHAVELATQVSDLRLLEQAKYIFVDEYQDLNVLEQRFVELLAAKSSLLLVVGDPDQSIYSFKYAHPDGIRSFFNEQHVESYFHLTTGRCGTNIVHFARELLKQSDPTRKEWLKALDNNEAGEVRFVRKPTQDEEFGHVLKTIVQKLDQGVSPRDIIVLAPRSGLGKEFVEFAEKNKAAAGLSEGRGEFRLIAKPTFTDEEQHCILLMGLLANPSSILHFRCDVGLGDETAFAAEIAELKAKHGSLKNVFALAHPDDFAKMKRRLRFLCTKIAKLRAFLESHSEEDLTDALLDEIFPPSVVSLAQLRSTLDDLRTPDDTLASLYNRFIEFIREIPDNPGVVRVMSLMASKGLEADHVFIIGCNAGNMPGTNRSSYLSDVQHTEEQRRFLYVGFTRAKKSLMVSWSRWIAFEKAKRSHTGSVATKRIKGRVYSQLAICPFLQDLPDVQWEV